LLRGGGAGAILSTLTVKAFSGTHSVHAANAAELGEFVGGFVGAFLALVSVALLYSTLKVRGTHRRRRILRTKYFELIKMRRDNAAAFELGLSSGTIFADVGLIHRDGLSEPYGSVACSTGKAGTAAAHRGECYVSRRLGSTVHLS
jgi:hypothetical protein